MRPLRHLGLGLSSGAILNGVRRLVRMLLAMRFSQKWLSEERITRHGAQWVINALFPPIPSVASRRMVANLLSPERRLHSAFLAVTDACLADCWHCSNDRSARGAPLSTEEWRGVIDQVQDLGACVIAFTGGEPLLRPDLPALVRHAVEGGAATVVLTAGIGHDRRALEVLAKAGLWALGVSLDSASPEVTRWLRKHPEAYAGALRSLQIGRELGLYTFINAVLDRDAVASGEHRRLHRLGEDLGVDELRLIEPKSCGRLMHAQEETFPGANERAELARFHCRVNRSDSGPKVCAFSHVERPERFGCCAGTLHLHLTASGEVCPCDVTPLSFGNVRSTPLGVIWGQMADGIGGPRRDCVVQSVRDEIRAAAGSEGFPLSPEISAIIVGESLRDGGLSDFERHHRW
jgi:MoaA/NifB/PqqE/SkfB family radical SAM enzyme